MDALEPEIAYFIHNIRDNGWRAIPSPLDYTLALAEAYPYLMGDLVEAILTELPNQDGLYLDVALSFLPLDAFPSLIERALATLRANFHYRATSVAIINYASLQFPAVLHPHLESLFTLEPLAGDMARDRKQRSRSLALVF